VLKSGGKVKFCTCKKAFIAVVLYFSIIISGCSHHSQTEKNSGNDWSRPEMINPLDKASGFFLDEELGYYDIKAHEAYNAKDYYKAAQYFLYILRYKYDHAPTLYNLACCFGLLGEADLAAKYLERAAEAGLTNIERLKTDSDFDLVRGNRIFDKTVANLVSWRKTIGSSGYISAEIFMKYRIHYPENFNADEKYNLVIGLHGSGGNTEAFSTLWKFLDKPDFIFVVPEAPYPRSQTIGIKRKQYFWDIPGLKEEFRVKGDKLIEKYILGVINEFSKNHKIDKVYLLGHSAGAVLSYYTGIKNNSLITGLICFAGVLPNTERFDYMLTEQEIRDGKDLKVFIVHGKQDFLAKYEEGMRVKNTLERNGYDVEFRDFEGGHSVPVDILREAVEWMKKQE